MQGGQRRSITWWTRRVGDERGAAVLETLLISVVLLLLFAGAVDVGRMYFSYIIITNVARRRCTYGGPLAMQPIQSC